MFNAAIRSVCAHCRSLGSQIRQQQQGQVLPIALAVLALGTLVIGPFLNHAGTALKSSGQYQKNIYELYACESGVQQAIWALNHLALEDALTEPGMTIEYLLSGTVNSLNTRVRVEWLTSEGVEVLLPGQVSEALMDSYKIADQAFVPRLVHIAGPVFAMFFCDQLSQGRVITFEINQDGQISRTLNDSCVFGALDCRDPEPVRVSENLVAVCYRGPDNDGFLQTLVISDSGQIDIEHSDTLEFDTDSCYEPSILQVGDGVFAVAYRGPKDDGWLKTMSINSNGQISENVIDSLEFDEKQCNEAELFQVDTGVFGTAYRGQSNDGTLATFSISADGVIGNDCIDRLEFDIHKGYEPDTVKVAPEIFAIAYRDNSKDGYIKTVRISSGGEIDETALDSLVIDSAGAYQPDIIQISGEVFALVYRGRQAEGSLATLSIGNTGLISSETLDSFVFESNQAENPDIIQVDSNLYAIAYSGPQSGGYIVTFRIGTGGLDDQGEENPGLTNTYRISGQAGGTVVQADVSINGSNLQIITWDISPP